MNKTNDVSGVLKSRMLSVTEQVTEFHKAFGMPVGTVKAEEFDEYRLAQIIPGEETANRLRLRLKLIREEYAEVLDAQSSEEVLKEVCDLVYVLVGLCVETGWDFDTAFKRVHESNMSKMGKEGSPVFRDDGKILKGPNYEKARMDDLV